MNDAYISLLCQDDKLAADLEACLDRADLGVDFVSSTWDVFASHLEGLQPDDSHVLVFMSLAQLCGGGLDGLMEADAFFQAHPHIHVLLLIEPWVSAERGSVELMTRFRMMLDAPLLEEQLGPLLSEILPDVSWSGESSASDGPIGADLRDGGVGLGRVGSLLSGSGMSASGGVSPSVSSGRVQASGVDPVVTVTLPDASDGDLSEVWLSRLIYSLYVRRFSGTLTLYHKRQEHRYALSEGVIEDLSRDHRQKLLSAFAWKEGRFELVPGQARGASFTDDTLRLIYDGLSGFVSLNRAAERLQGSDIKYPAQTRFFEERSEVLQDMATLRRFCTYCNGARNWSQLIALTWDDIRQVLKMACYALDTDLIVFREEPAQQALRVAYSNGAADSPGAALGESFDDISDCNDEDVLAARLEERLERFGAVDAYTIFGLYPTCGPVAVRERYYRLVKSYHPDVLGGNVSQRVKALAELTFIHIKDAYVELLEIEEGELDEEFIVTPSAKHNSSVRRDMPSSAERYQNFIADKLDEASADFDVNEVLEEQAKPSAQVDVVDVPLSRSSVQEASPEPGEDKSEPPQATLSNKDIKIRPARKRTARNAKQPTSGSTRRVRLGSGAPSTPVTPVSSESSAPSESSASASDKESEGKATRSSKPPSPAGSKPRSRSSKRGKDDAAASSASEQGASESSGGALNSERRRALTARLPPQQHFKNGERFLRAGQYAKAREAFKHAFKLKPEEPMYRAHFAWAKYMNDPAEEASAIELLKECLAIKKGRRVEANLFLARIYKRKNDTKEALKYFEMASKLDKNCTEALRELRLHKMRKDKGPESEALPEGEDGGTPDATSKMKSFFGQLFSRRKS